MFMDVVVGVKECAEDMAVLIAYGWGCKGVKECDGIVPVTFVYGWGCKSVMSP